MARDLGIVGLSFFLICNIVGAGVFFLQKVILVNTESVYLSLFCWVFAAFIAILFGLCYSELGSKYPEEGGDVVYFNKAYGSVACVIFSIVSMFVILPLGCALMLQLICHTINSDKTIGSYVTMPLIIVVINLCNWFGSTIIVKVQQFITILKVIVVTIFVVLSACVFTGFIKKVGGGTCAMNAPPTGANTFYGIMVAMFSTLWSFDGWNAGNFIAHRIQNPRRTLPIAITASVIIVSLLYLAINISFFSVLSCDTIKNSNRPLVYNYFYSLAINDYAKKFLTAFVSIIPSLGTLNGSFIVVMSILDGLTGNRENKQAYKLGGLMLFALVTFLAGLMDNPDKIISNISFCVYLFYGMSIYAITILRKKERVDKRIFKAPIIVVYSCVGISAAVVGFSLYKSILG